MTYRLIAAAASLIGLGIPAHAADDALEPAPLFKSFCTSGRGHLAEGIVTEKTYFTMPQPARVVLAFGAPRATGHNGGFDALPPGLVPNRIFTVDKHENEFLIVAAPGKTGPLAASCAVVWKGSRFDYARKAMYEILGAPMPQDDTRYEWNEPRDDGVNGNGYTMKAAYVDGWTMLRVTAEPQVAAK